MNRVARYALLALLVILSIGAIRDVSRLGDALPWRQMHDFRDFYCAGDAINQGRDPYRYEPLHSCEQHIGATSLFRGHPELVVPAPQPPYVLAAFAVLARLNFEAARTTYAVVLLLVVAGSVAALMRTNVPVDVATMALMLPLAYLELDAGQIVPLSFLFLTLTGAFLSSRRAVPAGICAALVAIEPHFGVPVALAILWFVPRARVAVVATAAALAAISCAAVGPATALAYVTHVLPAHALTELHFPYQYSVTYVLTSAGISGVAAQGASDVVYVALLLGGLWLARRNVMRLARPELYAFVPAMAATIGPFLHMDELCYAIPLALVFATALRGSLRTVSAVALCLLMVPWIIVWAVKKLYFAALLLCTGVLARLRIPIVASASTLIGIAAAIYIFELRPPYVPGPTGIVGRFAPDALAQVAWRAFTDAISVSDAHWLFIKIPTWLALIALLAVALINTRQPVKDGGGSVIAPRSKAT